MSYHEAARTDERASSRSVATTLARVVQTHGMGLFKAVFVK